MVDSIIILILLAILGGAGLYVYRAKKSGKKCIGCPVDCASGNGGCSTSSCSGNCAGCSGHCSSKSN